MKHLLLILFLASALSAQTPTGSVSVTTSIVAKAGADSDATQVVCTGSPGVPNATSFRMICTSAGATILSADAVLTSAPASSAVYSVQRGSNTVTWILTRGNPAPDGWSVAANGVQKSGSF